MWNIYVTPTWRTCWLNAIHLIESAPTLYGLCVINYSLFWVNLRKSYAPSSCSQSEFFVGWETSSVLTTFIFMNPSFGNDHSMHCCYSDTHTHTHLSTHRQHRCAHQEHTSLVCNGWIKRKHYINLNINHKQHRFAFSVFSLNLWWERHSHYFGIFWCMLFRCALSVYWRIHISDVEN